MASQQQIEQAIERRRQRQAQRIDEHNFDTMAYNLIDTLHEKLDLDVDRDGFVDQELYVAAFDRLTEAVWGYLNAIPAGKV